MSKEIKMSDTEKGIRASAVMDFVDMIRGAYASGFIDNYPTNYDIYRSAQVHVKDRYGVQTDNWDDELAKESRINNHDRLVEENKRLREERDEAIELAKRANKGYSHMIKLHNNYLSEQITSTDLNEPDYIDHQDVYEIGRDVFMLENGLSEEDMKGVLRSDVE